MSNIVHITPDRIFETTQHNELDEFKIDLIDGLSKKPKAIKSKYLYDKKGSQLFNKLTKHPDYYLTGSELTILEYARHSIAELLSGVTLNLVEFGPGEGIKTALLLQHFLLKKIPVTYVPIDISSQYLKKIITKFEKISCNFPILALHADFIKGLEWIKLDSDSCNLVLFLGSSIGNFTTSEAQFFFTDMRRHLHKNDYALIGFDLCQNEEILMKAYNNSDGITRDFNLNLLHRINHELNANFNTKQFRHHAQYNPAIGAMESYLISLDSQTVTIPSINKTITFDQAESIHAAYSHKYSLKQIENFAQKSGFQIIQHYLDPQGYFVDSLWQAI